MPLPGRTSFGRGWSQSQCPVERNTPTLPLSSSVKSGAWKNSKEDVDALDGYLKQFAPKADKPAEGNEKAASLVNAYNAIA